MPKIVNKCGNSPLFGGRNPSASKFCKDHISLNGDEPTAKNIMLTIDAPHHTMSSKIADTGRSLPSNDDKSMHTVCKKDSSVQHVHDQTAGIMAIGRPCDIVLDLMSSTLVRAAGSCWYCFFSWWMRTIPGIPIFATTEPVSLSPFEVIYIKKGM